MDTSFKIGEMVVSLRTENVKHEFLVEDTYQRFATREPPQVVLNHHLQPPPSLANWEVVFNSQGIWQLFRQMTDAGVHYAVALYSPVYGSSPYQVGIFNDSFSAGDLFTEPQYFTDRPQPFPLRYPMAEVITINLLSHNRGILLHACAVRDEQQGYLFAGVSGAGKSTTANLWQNQPGVKLLSDDRVILRKKEGAFWIYGTPWHGDARAAGHDCVRLAKVFILRHGRQNQATALKPFDLVTRLLVRSFPPFWDAAGMDYSLGLLSEMSQVVPGYDFDFLPDQSAVEFVRCASAR